MILKNMLNMQMMMFLLVLIGFLIRKQNIVETEGRKNMVDLCLYVTLPFNILNSFCRLEMGNAYFVQCDFAIVSRIQCSQCFSEFGVV